MQIKIFPTIEKLNEFAAEKFIEIGIEAIEKRGQMTVALSGGSTPKPLFQLLASDKYKNRLDWKSVFFFFGDERNVAPESEESNFRMANENLFEPLKIKTENIFRWKTELDDAGKIAEDYDKTIRKFFDAGRNPPAYGKRNPSAYADGSDRKNPSAYGGGADGKFPRFDLIFLGMGDDGHTASLFPLTKALNETEKIAVENFVEKLDTWRFTLTFPAINNAENIIFLIKGDDKAETLKEVLEGGLQTEKFPSQKVRPAHGNLFWLIDETAARLLDRTNS